MKSLITPICTASLLAEMLLASGSTQGLVDRSGMPISEARLNIREACRRKIAGHYLHIYDAREQSRKSLISYKETLKRIEKALKQATADLKEARAAAENAGFDLAKAAKRDQFEAYVNTLTADQADTSKLIASTEADLKKHTTAEKNQRAAIEKVFVFERVEDRPDGGYPMELKYRSACPKYRYLCPLPAKELKDLLAIEIDGHPPEECERYAGMPQKPLAPVSKGER